MWNMDKYKIDAIEINPKQLANASIIWLHGLGASGDDFVSISKELNFIDNLQVRFIFPHAPIKPITINNGCKMRAWYDIKDFSELIQNDPENDTSHEGLNSSMELINHVIHREIELGIEPEKIVLAGFSQGGALALYTGLRCKYKLAGTICLSGYLPLHYCLLQEQSKSNMLMPILMAHGKLDQIIPITFGKKSYSFLKQLGYNILWNDYLMQHTVIEQEIYDINNFLNKILKY